MAGVMAIETSCAGITVRLVEPLIEPEVAEMVAVPMPTLVESPDVDMTATADESDFQFTEVVMSCVLPSE